MHALVFGTSRHTPSFVVLRNPKNVYDETCEELTNLSMNDVTIKTTKEA